jgi:hypothetical protein
MNDEPKLSDQEWALVVELLESERNQLPVEIHHTGNASVRMELHRREELVDGLLERLHQPEAVCLPL